MKKTIVIRSAAQYREFCQQGEGWNYGERPLRFTVEPYKKNRTNAQNSLQWAWYGEAARERGETVKQVERYCKLIFGCPILLSDDSGFVALYSAIEPLPWEKQLEAMDYISVTSIMKVPQHQEYLRAIENHYLGLGIILSKDLQAYEEAIGK